MAHEEIKGSLKVAEESGRISFAIALTLLGGVLLLCAVAAKFIFEGTGEPGIDNPYSQALALLATVLLGTPLVWTALKDLWEGHMHMNELVALAVLAAFAMADMGPAARAARAAPLVPHFIPERAKRVQRA